MPQTVCFFIIIQKYTQKAPERTKKKGKNREKYRKLIQRIKSTQRL